MAALEPPTVAVSAGHRFVSPAYAAPEQIQGQPLDERVDVGVAGGELTVTWPGPGKNIWLTGPAEVSFTGSVEIEA